MSFLDKILFKQKKGEVLRLVDALLKKIGKLESGLGAELSKDFREGVSATAVGVVEELFERGIVDKETLEEAQKRITEWFSSQK